MTPTQVDKGSTKREIDSSLGSQPCVTTMNTKDCEGLGDLLLCHDDTKVPVGIKDGEHGPGVRITQRPLNGENQIIGVRRY